MPYRTTSIILLIVCSLSIAIWDFNALSDKVNRFYFVVPPWGFVRPRKMMYLQSLFAASALGTAGMVKKC